MKDTVFTERLIEAGVNPKTAKRLADQNAINAKSSSKAFKNEGINMKLVVLDLFGNQQTKMGNYLLLLTADQKKETAPLFMKCGQRQFG